MVSTISPTILKTSTSKLINLSAGCFWGVENVFRKQFTNKGLVDIKVGYANGKPSISNVTYEKVCTGTTDYAETVQISYEPSQLKLAEILDIFFKMHDPTTVNSQGPDVGTQYRSAIFTFDDEDKSLALKIRDQFQKEWYPNHKIATTIETIYNWYDAEDYHQNYLTKNSVGYECPTHFIRTKPKI
ncbi:peptide-methionine (S)-S-oxide reductase [Candida albicans P57072]|nr:peptide-methionine (S)-S-oxide reductase [Candida albicans P94015]KGR13180.1 peptide-methionine (S)-S-oxide reductase [Candida albicans P57072]KHC39177.1 peptide-methionine (S)-S-oxide reductase [Candida albicans P76067]KHC66498.1 peptide-methionine (S)-S-oxide reductase [Candida albicans P75010]KHC82458.1 peptide-methionine (S)-S-oxide reductase [Candida albicans P78042]